MNVERAAMPDHDELRCITEGCNRFAHYDEATEWCDGQQYQYCDGCLDRQAESYREHQEWLYYQTDIFRGGDDS